MDDLLQTMLEVERAVKLLCGFDNIYKPHTKYGKLIKMGVKSITAASSEYADRLRERRMS